MGQAIRQVKQGDRVIIHFNGLLDDGTLFDTTYEIDGCEDDNCDCDDSGDGCEKDDCGCSGEIGPYELEVGADEFSPQVEQALIGMSPGDKKTIKVKCEDAFGEYDPEQVSTVPRNQFPDDITPAVGDNFELTSDDGEGIVVTVIEVTDLEVTLDANHPLAGEDLTFEVELVEIP